MQIIYNHMALSIIIQHEKSLNRSNRPIERTLIGTTTPIQSGTGSNDNEGALLTPMI